MTAKLGLITLVLAVVASALVTTLAPPGLQGEWFDPSQALDLTGNVTDMTAIVASALALGQTNATSNDNVPTFSRRQLGEPSTPDGYEFVFGPVSAANEAPGYMGFVFLDQYDVEACAQQCNTRGSDAQGGLCQFFNIWRAVVHGTPITYTCSMYFIPTNASTAVNTGQGALQVTFSRGYRRTNLVIDGGFEAFSGCTSFCYGTSDAHWVATSSQGGIYDASIFHFQPYAHSGNAVALLGSANGDDALSGTLTVVRPLTTVAGRRYVIGFFQASSFSPPAQEQAAFIDVKWNGVTAKTFRPGFSNWEFLQVEVTGLGNDVLSFHGGAAPAWTFIDDITVFEL